MPHSPTVHLDLRGLAPAPERILEIVRATVEMPVASIAIEWGDRFPWGLDEATVARDAFPESLLAEADAILRASTSTHAVVLRAAFPSAYASLRAYRHLERARRRSADEWRRAAGKLASDLLDDLRSLLPSVTTVCLAAGSPDEALVREAAALLGLEVGRLAEEAAQSGGTGGIRGTGGIEERLERVAHPAATDRGIAGLHDRLRQWRAERWLEVSILHELVVQASDMPTARARELSDAVRRLARGLGGFRSLESEFRGAYQGLATEDAVVRFLAATRAPLHEQYTALAARATTLRAGRR